MTTAIFNPEKSTCKERGCTANTYKAGLCYHHYEEVEEDKAEHRADLMREEKVFGKIERERNKN